jgi:hypothetical protein
MRRPLTWEILRHILWQMGGYGSLAVGVLWLLTIVTVTLDFFGIQLVRRQIVGEDSALTPAMALAFAAVVTAVAVLWYPPKIWRALHLARVSQRVNGTVRRMLGVTIHGFETILVTYTVEQKSYTAKFGVDAEKFAVGAPAAILYDPHRPRVALLQESVLPPKVGRALFDQA